MFTDLDGVEIVDNEGNTERHEHMAFVQVTKVGKEYWFVLRDVGAEELRQMQMQANIEYIAMMTDVEL